MMVVVEGGVYGNVCSINRVKQSFVVVLDDVTLRIVTAKIA